MEMVRFLQDQPLFGGVGDAAMQAIMRLMRPQEFAAGDVIVREGEDGDSLFVICSGTVEVLKACPTAADPLGKRIAVLDVGDVFGEMELIDMQRRSARIRALQPVRVLALSNGGLFQIYESDLPTFTLIVMNLARELSVACAVSMSWRYARCLSLHPRQPIELVALPEVRGRSWSCRHGDGFPVWTACRWPCCVDADRQSARCTTRR